MVSSLWLFQHDLLVFGESECKLDINCWIEIYMFVVAFVISGVNFHNTCFVAARASSILNWFNHYNII